MEVIKVTPRGFCKGVVNAIQIAKQTRKQYPNEPITILGRLVHNQYVVDALSRYHIQTIDRPQCSRYELLDEIHAGIVIFSAHGVSDRVKEKAEQKGLKIVDATCENVAYIHTLIKQKIDAGYEIGYIGKAHHPESEAVLEISEHVHLIENESDLDFHHEKLFFTNQTTLSCLEVQHLYDQIKKRYPHAIISNDICDATLCRQKALMELNEIDALIVVGDPKSHNTQKLASIGQQVASQIFCVEHVEQLLQYDLSTLKKVAVTSGASTPTKITNQLIHYLETGELIPLAIDEIL